MLRTLQLLPFPIALFDLVLAVLAIVNITLPNSPSGTVAASWILCATSFLAFFSLALVTAACYAHGRAWMGERAKVFEVVWMGGVLVLQLIGAISTSTISLHVHPTHRAALAFSWTCTLLATAYIVLLALLPIPPPTSSPGFIEKGHHSHSSTSSINSFSGNRPNKPRPAPLNLTKISVTSLPVYNAHQTKPKPQPSLPPPQPRPMGRHHQMSSNRPTLLTTTGQTHRANSQSSISHSVYSTQSWVPQDEWLSPTSFLSIGGGEADAKELPALPAAAKTRMGGGVMDRPDPRDKKPSRAGEVRDEGGFWVTRHAGVRD